MSMGQVAIAELRKRVGRVDPVTGFQIIDAMLKSRDESLDMFEQLACGMAWHQGQIAACIERGDVASVAALHALETSWLSPVQGPMLVVPKGL